MGRPLRVVVIAGAAALLLPASAGTTAKPHRPTAALVIPPLYKNCTNLNKRYPHGVGRLRAVDKTSGDPVTNFRRSTRIYNQAMSHNKRLDRDKDGIACEKA